MVIALQRAAGARELQAIDFTSDHIWSGLERQGHIA
jgi:hypothetical protein